LGDGGQVDEMSFDIVSVEFRFIVLLQGIITWQVDFTVGTVQSGHDCVIRLWMKINFYLNRSSIYHQILPINQKSPFSANFSPDFSSSFHDYEL